METVIDRNGKQLDDTTVYMIHNSIIFCACCAPASMTPEGVEAHVNRENPAGTTHGWGITDDNFPDGWEGDNPNPCPNDPEGRRHYLLNC